MPHPFKSGTLRRTLVIYLLIACLFPPILFSAYTYSSLHSILTGKIRSGIDASLKQEATGMENMLNDLDFVSKQFALDGRLAELVNRYLKTSKTYDKAEIKQDIEDSLNLVNFTSPNVGLTVYYMPKAADPVLFNNLPVADGFSIDNLPPFVQYKGAVFHGPHRTQYKNSDNTVISSLRVVRTEQQTPVYIYLESNYNLFRKILNSALYGMKVSHYVFDEEGDALFADDGEPPARSEAAALRRDRRLRRRALSGLLSVRLREPAGLEADDGRQQKRIQSGDQRLVPAAGALVRLRFRLRDHARDARLAQGIRLDPQGEPRDRPHDPGSGSAGPIYEGGRVRSAPRQLPGHEDDGQRADQRDRPQRTGQVSIGDGKAAEPDQPAFSP
ncbi:hypothetical protein OMP38_18295 [Cohnella ginsengisoli]|uniref:Cache domain-containing protein n=1 Tax=Cohnella ginsengisoli TaxID=425004 RepID=A0A9X4KJH7_9BACL|nr:hypothetical protein [Cohnella ginsengisoli]MDG0792609.1 hypothetical protein [Cohnella ginsengisoli]